MSRSGYPILFLVKKHNFTCKCKSFLSYVVSSERYFSIQDSGNNDGLDEKDTNSSPKQGKSQGTPDKKNESSLKMKVITEESKEAAKKKLFSLLSELKIEDSNKKVAPNLNLAKAMKRPLKKERFKDILEKKQPDEEMQTAVEHVAQSVSGDPEKIKFELRGRLSSLNLIEKPQNYADLKEEGAFLDGDINMDIMSSVKEVAASVTDSSAPIKSKLTERLMRLHLESKSSASSKKSIDNIVKDMKVESWKGQMGRKRTEPADHLEPPQRRQPRTRQVPAERSPLESKISILKSPPLGIFPPDTEIQAEPKKTVWKKLEEKNLKLMVEFAPRNAFEEMIMWTEQGKHWKLPINNQIDMGEEEKVGFHEHVFLEQHKHGFPKKGPINHFMELVVVGLSKNPYITVERKIENIDWFRTYFNEKADILKQYGALES